MMTDHVTGPSAALLRDTPTPAWTRYTRDLHLSATSSGVSSGLSINFRLVGGKKRKPPLTITSRLFHDSPV
ncbi:hypothetical protein RRG08_013391 [Elysia crispata]|uniref:Uncharacterized protein n=1 Tax=Elysia crispata TaxID=231223 RepID=A0AAE1EBH8_9GAST|nr:hypothetical protein RRG08_013391 [Elysia crispata]